VIVPARDEERTLPRLLASLSGQEMQPHEIIVVDDGSTDRTAEVARAAGARVVASKPLPENWRGKTWACAQGAKAATGQVFLFVDADTFFEEGGWGRILDTFVERRGVMSVGAYHRVERLYEELSAFFNILMTAGTGAFTIAGRRRPPAGLFGPFLMVDRDAYYACGGHGAVRDKILENFHFARQFRNRGISVRCLGGRGSFGMRMYPDGPASLLEGWSKAFASGSAETPKWILLASVAWIAGAVLAAMWAGWGLAVWRPLQLACGGALYLIFLLQLWSILRRIGSFRFVTALVYPIPLLFYLVVFARSSIFALFGKKVTWKGREIDVDSSKG